MIKYLFSFLIALVIVCTGYYFLVALPTVPPFSPAQTYVAIGPYSVIASKSVRDFYATIKQQFGNVDNVIIVFPIYSRGGNKKFTTRCGQSTKVCSDGQCQEVGDIRQYISGSGGILHVYSGSQDNGEVFDGQRSLGFLKGHDTLNCGNASFFQTGFFDLGHQENGTGQSMIKKFTIREHFRFIAETFSGVKTFPIGINPNDLHQANILVSLLSHHTLPGKTLILGLSDFSHHVPEPFAEHHDRRTWYELIYDIDKNISDAIPYLDLDVDCPACLMTVQEIAKVFDQRGITLRRRDSSEQLLGSNDNVSRMFIMYGQHKETKDTQNYQGDTRKGEEIQRGKKLSFALSGGTTQERGLQHFSTGNQGIVIAFFGDAIYDRWVHKMNPTLKDLQKRLSGFASKGSFPQHTLLGGADMALLNLETPLVEHLHQCNKLDKPYSFCSHERIAQVLTEMHFDAVNIINNHSYDNRYKGIGYTTGVLGKWGLGYFGNFANYGLTGINIQWTGEVRGQKFVRLGYDLTITQQHRTGYIQEVRNYASRGFFPLVSVHWGVEYETRHNQFQEDFAHKLIDAGAEAVIGHHPHVPQDTERYNGKPIVYSLGNFLFDQGFSEETKKGMYVLLDLQPEGESVMWTGKVNAYYE